MLLSFFNYFTLNITFIFISFFSCFSSITPLLMHNIFSLNIHPFMFGNYALVWSNISFRIIFFVLFHSLYLLFSIIFHMNSANFNFYVDINYFLYCKKWVRNTKIFFSLNPPQFSKKKCFFFVDLQLLSVVLTMKLFDFVELEWKWETQFVGNWQN